MTDRDVTMTLLNRTDNPDAYVKVYKGGAFTGDRKRITLDGYHLARVEVHDEEPPEDDEDGERYPFEDGVFTFYMEFYIDPSAAGSMQTNPTGTTTAAYIERCFTRMGPDLLSEMDYQAPVGEDVLDAMLWEELEQRWEWEASP